MKIVAFKHFDFDDDCAFATWAANREHEWIVKDPAKGIQKEWLADMDLLVILGGPMSVYQEDRFTWLADEKLFVKQAIENGKNVLGICLGAQMIAEVLGGAVYRTKNKEIGWRKIHRTAANHPWLDGLPKHFYSFQWHGDTFDLPRGAQRLAYSDACENQAFCYGERVVGLQFHLETSPICIESMIAHWSDELVDAPYIQPVEHIRRETFRSAASWRMLHGILSRIESGFN